MLVQSKIDTSEYYHYVLANKILVLIIKNVLFKKSSCALSVGAGSYGDPDDRLGLAHFLEHMVFMGTEKYPTENGFSEFINLHNGKYNAYTADEYTTYYFEVDSDHLKVGADMLANFFISPLLRESSVSREVNAVNSEYEKTLCNSAWRKFMLLNDLIKTDRIEGRFNCGNSETLSKSGIIGALREFWEKKYSSDITTLVICGNAPMDELVEVASLFEGIPNRHLKSEKAPSEKSVVNITSDMFKNEYLSNVVHFKPLDGKNELIIHTILSPIRDLFRINPIGYVNEMLSKMEDGGLVSKLKDMALASGVIPRCYYLNGYTHVTINIKLTKKGFRQYKDIISITQEFISKMKADKHEYERLSKLGSLDFAYKPIDPPMKMSTDLVIRLLNYPVENVLNYKYLYEEFDEHVINSCISAISDASKWIILIGDTDENATYTNKEKFYGVEYGIYDSLEPKSSELELENPHVYESNQKCVAEDHLVNQLEVIKSESRYLKRSVYPNGEVNFVFDSEFDLPKMYLRVIFASDAVKENPISYELYFNTLIDMFQTKYGRELRNARAELYICKHNEGVCLRLTGFSDSLLEIAKLFFTSVSEWTSLSEDGMEKLVVPLNRFEVVRQNLQDYYATIIARSPFERLSECYTHKLASMKTTEELFEQVKHVKKDDVTFKKDFFCKIIAVGNGEFNKIEDLYNTISETYLKECTCSAAPAGIKVCDSVRTSFVTMDKTNNAIGVFYTMCNRRENAVPVDSENTAENKLVISNPYYVKTAIGQLIYQIANERFFNELRTNENLGYIVKNATMQYYTARFLQFIVQSKKSVEFLEERILKFVVDLKAWIKNMSDEEFNGFKNSLIGSYKMPIVNLEDLDSFVFNLHCNGEIDLDYKKKMVEIAEGLTREDLLDSDLWNSYGCSYSEQQVNK